jgi:hypothetical protein
VAQTDWYGLPSPAAVRVTAGLVLAAAASVLGALVLGEYQFDGLLPVAAGVIFGLVVAEIAVEVGRRRTWPIAVACAALAAAGLVWAGWISAGEGLNPIAGGAWLAAGLAAVTAIVRFAPWKPTYSDPEATSSQVEAS